MTAITLSYSHIGCLVANAVLGRSGKLFQREVDTYLEKNGPEWTVKRLKAIWNAANLLRNGDERSAIQVYRQHSIAYHKGSKLPKGQFGPVVNGFVSASRPSVIKRYAAVLRYYTSMRLSELSPAQSDKAKRAIVGTPADQNELETARDIFDEESKGLIPPKLISYFRSQPMRATIDTPEDVIPFLKMTSAYYSHVPLPRDLRNVPPYSMVQSFLTEGWIPESIEARTGLGYLRDAVSKGTPSNQPVGRISVLQEQGAKARVVAVPSAQLQMAFYPLHQLLDKAIQEAPILSQVSGVHDQTRAVRSVAKFHAKGNHVHTSDLSSATDRFPRSFSMRMLELFGLGEWAEAIEQVSTAKWQSPWGDVSYGKGQPMGLYSSFPLFHISNVLVALLAEQRVLLMEKKQVKRFDNGHTFWVVGDDVVFSDPHVIQHYDRIITDLGVEISSTKSYSGRHVEFLGNLITPSKVGTLAFRPYKVPDGPMVSNPIQFLDSLGASVKKLRRNDYWERWWNIYIKTAGRRKIDLSPLFPEEKEMEGRPMRLSGLDLDTFANVLIERQREALPSGIPANPFTRTAVDSDGVTFSITPMPENVNRHRALSPVRDNLSRFDRDSVKPKDERHPMRESARLAQDPLLREERDKQDREVSTVPFLQFVQGDEEPHMETEDPAPQTEPDQETPLQRYLREQSSKVESPSNKSRGQDGPSFGE